MTADSTWAFALYDCDAEQADELAFRAGDLLHMLQARMSEAGDDWIMAANPRTRCQGEVPTNYITYAHGYSAALDAFKETDRPGATNLLHSRDYLNKFNYVVRPSSDPSVLALSIRNAEQNIRHYKIYFGSCDQSCSLFPGLTFKTIEDLIIHYMENEIAPGCILQAYKPLNGFSSS